MFFNYDLLGSMELASSPYRYLTHDASIIDQGKLEELIRTFPKTNKTGHNYVDEISLSKEWEDFTNEIKSDTYREAMEKITGLELLRYEVGIGIRTLSKISHGSPHSDVSRKKITHLIYFNEEWPHQTGQLRVLGSKDLNDVRDTVSPVKGAGLIFVVSRNSFHGFESFEGERKAIQINFEKTGLLSKIFERYD